jgi:hypothetical protein
MIGERWPMVKLAELWGRTSVAGNRYFSGYLGRAQLLLFDTGEQPPPNRPDETWNLLVQERDQAPRPGARNAEKGQRSWNAAASATLTSSKFGAGATRHVERHATRTRAQQAGEGGLAERRRSQEPLHGDYDLAVADLRGRGR